jgi:hypothetical protein
MIIDGVSVSPQLKTSTILGRGSADRNAKPVIQLKAQDLRDRVPYGLPAAPGDVQVSGVLLPWQFKGRGRIVGTVKEKSTPTNIPLGRRVRLYREPDGRLIRTTWSDPVTGAYVFNGIPLGAVYSVVSYDHTGLYRAVIGDNLAPEPIP